MKKDTRIRVWHKFNSRCAYCGDHILFQNMQVDHVIPKAFFRYQVTNCKNIPHFLSHLTEQDVDNIDNLFPACRVCNKFKSAHHLELFRSELQDQLNRANKYSSNYRFAKKFNQVKETPEPIIFYFETRLGFN